MQQRVMRRFPDRFGHDGDVLTIHRNCLCWMPPASPPAQVAEPAFDTSVMTTTMTRAVATHADTPLSFALAANEARPFRAYLLVGSALLGGLRVQLTGPSSPALVAAQMVATGSALTAIIQNRINGFGVPSSPFCTLLTGEGYAEINGTVVNGPNAGTVRLQLASSGLGTVTLYAGSYLTAFKGST